jgi:3-hydroxyacyl-[acyl-carrier-protein] dehydratase
MMDQKQIMERIPHRPPFLLLDRVEEVTEGRIVALKNVTGDESFLRGPDRVMPGLLQVEVIAQAAAVYASTVYDLNGKMVYILAMSGIRFLEPVHAGDTLRVEVELLRFGGRISRVRGRGFVGERQVVEATITAGVADMPG